MSFKFKQFIFKKVWLFSNLLTVSFKNRLHEWTNKKFLVKCLLTKAGFNWNTIPVIRLRTFLPLFLKFRKRRNCCFDLLFLDWSDKILFHFMGCCFLGKRTKPEKFHFNEQDWLLNDNYFNKRFPKVSFKKLILFFGGIENAF